ncbi:MAG: methyltransferase domain-containing protein [Acholeplasmatales bacterium]|nr:methyltransferase domain-containing protein [Acholeplasmatales bacterium]
MAKWDSNTYSKFIEERHRPSKDLISRLNDHKNILDIGSGPGNSTYELYKKYNNANIIGAEADDNMLLKANNNYPNLRFIKAFMPDDFNKFGLFDLIYSNACIHWIENQELLFNEIFNHLEDNGVVAIQIPLTQESEFYKMLYKLIDDKYPELKNINNFHNLDKYGYYNLLNKIGFKKIEIWETTYVHHVNNIDDIITWYSGSGLKPYLDRINDKEMFINDLKELINKKYTMLDDGTYFLLMPRLFFIANK